jgi:hypothetical protein
MRETDLLQGYSKVQRKALLLAATSHTHLQERAQCRIRAEGLAPPRLRFLHASIVDAAAAACAGILPSLDEPVSRRDGLPLQADQTAMPQALPVPSGGTRDSAAAAPSEGGGPGRFDLIRCI